MSMYNMVMGASPLAGLVMALLRMNPEKVPRLRDAWVADNGKTLIVLTRTGGGNRPDYAAENEWMKDHTGFVTEHDDPVDSTFAHFVYRAPEELQADLAEVTKFLIACGLGADTRGPGAMVQALDRKPVEHGLTKDSPEAVAMQAAYERILNHIRKTQPNHEEETHAEPGDSHQA